MQAGEWNEEEFFRALASGGARVLMIGRRAMVVLGIPVLTADYDLWVHIDDVALLNSLLEPLDLVPNRTPEEARLRGRYVLEGDEHVDVLVARSAPDRETSEVLRFEDAWTRRQSVEYERSAIAIPSVEDMIRTKRWALRPKDLTDIQLLESFRKRTP